MQRTANDKRTALTTLISDALLPGEESKFLARKGTRHYARLCSAKVWEVCCIYQMQQKGFLFLVQVRRTLICLLRTSSRG